MTSETESVFKALFALEEVRELLRETAPKHELDAHRKERLKTALIKVKSSLEVLEKWSK
ncbi:MAG: hypothetical protein ABH851_05420 [Methanobacteriota archaeon]